MTSSPLGKGKGRADPLPSSSFSTASSLHPSVHSNLSTPRRKRALRHGRGPLIRDSDDEGSIGVPEGLQRQDPIDLGAMLCLAIGVGCGLLLLAVAITHLWLGHVISEQGGVAEMGRGVAVGVKGVKWGEGGVEVWGKAGVDVKRALGWEKKEKGGWLRRFEARVAKWGTGEVGSASVRVGRAVLTTAEGEELVVVKGFDTLVLPLSYPVGRAAPRMDDYSLVLPLDVVEPALLRKIAKEAWTSGEYAVRVVMEGVQVEPGIVAQGFVSRLIRKLGAIKIGDVLKEVSGRGLLVFLRTFSAPLTPRRAVPHLPGSGDPSSLISLKRYSISPSTSPTTNASVVALSASATLSNPLHNSSFLDGQLAHLAYELPFRFPVAVFLSGSNSTADDVLIAQVSSDPFAFERGDAKTPLAIKGQLVPTNSSKTPATFTSAISTFLARYIAGKNNTVLIRYDPSPPPTDDSVPLPPPFFAPLLEELTIPFDFPAPSSHMELFRNLRIEDMKIRLSSLSADDPEGDLLCSGKVVGEVVLPERFASLESAIDVRSILPDVFVYDGDLPSFSSFLLPASQLAFSSSAASEAYPPSPIPASAFARLRPSLSIPSLTTHTPANTTHPSTTLISATFLDAPLFLLPGRGEVFRHFVGKIIFGGPGAKVRAGVRGLTGVGVEVRGWGEVELEGLPIEGSFDVGRGGAESGLL